MGSWGTVMGGYGVVGGFMGRYGALQPPLTFSGSKVSGWGQRFGPDQNSVPEFVFCGVRGQRSGVRGQGSEGTGSEGTEGPITPTDPITPIDPIIPNPPIAPNTPPTPPWPPHRGARRRGAAFG